MSSKDTPDVIVWIIVIIAGLVSLVDLVDSLNWNLDLISGIKSNWN